MTPEAEGALRESISHWEKIARGEESAQGAKNCPLCQKYNNKQTPEICLGCPVYELTGQRFCDGTPYREFTNASDVSAERSRGYVVAGPASRAAAETELAFLRSLLPSDAGQMALQIEGLTLPQVQGERWAINARIADLVFGPQRRSGPPEGPARLLWWSGGLGTESAPDFLGSLDAALPGEDIDGVSHLSDGTWFASARAHLVSQSGRGVTETVARRAAALRVWGIREINNGQAFENARERP